MSSCQPSTQHPLPALPVLHRNGLDVAPDMAPDMALDAALGLPGRTTRTTLAKPVPTLKRTLNANVIIKVHEVGAP